MPRTTLLGRQWHMWVKLTKLFLDPHQAKWKQSVQIQNMLWVNDET